VPSHSHYTSRKGNSTSVGDTLFKGRQQRSTHYGELQYDADWPEVLSEGEMILLRREKCQERHCECGAGKLTLGKESVEAELLSE